LHVKLSDELTIHYVKAGSGPNTILFAPGWSMSTACFEKQLAAFEESTEYTFVTYDPRSQGLSSKTEGGHFYQQHGRDLNAFIEALELRNIVLGGWSFGGNEVLSYVNQFGTGRLAAFIMIDAAPKTTGADNTKEWIWYRYDDADGAAKLFTMGPLLDREGTITAFADWMLADKSPEKLAFVHRMAAQTPSTVMALLNAAASHDDYTDDLRAMEGKLPLLYTVRKEWGDAATTWALENTPGATVSTTMNSHMDFWERPESFNALLLDFLTEVKSFNITDGS